MAAWKRRRTLGSMVPASQRPGPNDQTRTKIRYANSWSDRPRTNAICEKLHFADENLWVGKDPSTSTARGAGAFLTRLARALDLPPFPIIHAIRAGLFPDAA
jgi:hypothetical protein